MSASTIRTATPADHGTYAKLCLELGVDNPVFPLERFVSEMMATTLIAERDGQARGYAFFNPMKEVVHLSHLVTAPEARGEGVGRALMAEVARRARDVGCAQMTLNVLPDNTPAIRLYESFGLRRSHTNHGLRIEWAMVDRQPESAVPLAEHAREIAPEEDAVLEAEYRLPTGILAAKRARPGRVLRAITLERGRTALAAFDVGFPGVHPFRAPDLAHALSLLRALRPFARLARPEYAFVNVMVEDQPDVAQALLRAGATLRLETTFMRGPIPR